MRKTRSRYSALDTSEIVVCRTVITAGSLSAEVQQQADGSLFAKWGPAHRGSLYIGMFNGDSVIDLNATGYWG